MRTSLLTLLVLISAFSAIAQPKKGSITGKVIDANGLPIPYALVLAEGTSFGATTNEQGVFVLKMPVGNYTLVAKALAYTSQSLAVEITEGKSDAISFKLEDDVTQLGDIVITGVKTKSASATRTIMEIQDIPQAIVVMGQKVIEQQAAFDLTTITRNISGLNFTGNYSGAGSYQFFNARGFDLVNSQNYRWNGMMIWNLGNNYSDNIEQVEFLKGPTSILFGDVAPGGVMNFSTKKPLADFFMNVNFKTGQWNLMRPSVDISGPVTKNKTLRYRLNTSYEKSDSFRDFVTSERLLLAPTIAWDITPKLSFTTEAVFRKSEATDDPGLVSPDGTVKGLDDLAPSLYLSEPDHKYLFSDQSYFGTLTYQISDNWRIRGVGFYGYTENRPFGTWPDQPEDNGDFVRRQYGYKQWLKNNSASLDAYGTFYTGSVKHNLLVGVEFQATNFRYTDDGSLDSLDRNNIFNPVYGLNPLIEPSEDSYLPFKSIIQRKGIYLQDQIMFFNEKLHLLLGVRLGRTEQGNDYYEAELPGSDYDGYVDDIVSKNVWSPRIGFVYKPSPIASIYASWSQGYEINSPDIFAQNFAEFSTPPATLSSQIEFGTKANLLSEKLGVTLSVFQINKKDPYGFVYLDPENPDFDLYNVYYSGHHRSQGIEIDVDGRIHPTLSLTAGAAFTDTEVVEDPAYPAGNSLPNAPRLTGNFWINYEPQRVIKGFSAGFGYFYKSDFFSAIDNNPDLKIPGNFTIDISAGYEYKQASFQVNVSNLTNEVAYLNPWIFNLFDIRPLRRVIITLNYKLGKR